MSKLRDFGKIDKQYREYKDNKESIKRLYENIKQEYKNDKNLDIVLERVFLLNQKEKYRGLTVNLTINLMIMIFNVFIAALLTQLFKNMSVYSILLCYFIILFVIYISIILAYKGNIFYERNESIYFDIRLAALYEIERELKSSTKWEEPGLFLAIILLIVFKTGCTCYTWIRMGNRAN